MAVRFVTIFQPREGKRDEFLKEVAQAKEHLTRLGGRFRLGEMVVGGPLTGQMVITIEFDNLAAYATFIDARNADKEWQEFQRKADRENGTRTLVSRSLVQDLM